MYKLLKVNIMVNKVLQTGVVLGGMLLENGTTHITVHTIPQPSKVFHVNGARVDNFKTDDHV